MRYEFGGGNDSLDGSLLTETVEAHGGEGRDTLIGGSGMDFLFGGPSADSLQGGDGADLLRGDGAALAEDALLSPSTVILPVLEPSNRSRPGVDTIEGGGGDDVIDGGPEADHLYGGTGADTFYYDSVRDFGDVIHDFDAGFGGDKIVVDRLVRLAPGTTQLDYFRLEQVGDDVNLMVDLDAGGTEFGEQLLAVLLDTAAGAVSLQAYFGQVWIGQEWRDNTAPVAEDDDIAIVEDQQAIGMLPLAFDDDADPVRYTLETQAANGIAEVTRDGLYRYTPEPGFAGMDSFEYTVADYRGSNTYTVNVEVASTNRAPTASGANVQAQEDIELSGQLPVATDLDGDDVTYTLASAASQGSATVSPDGSFTYLGDSNYYGADSFEFTVSDGEAQNTYTISVDVAQVDDTITGTAADDLLVDDTNGPSLLQGLGGDDGLQGGSDEDTLEGGAGADTLEGGSGDDTAEGGDGVDLLRFGAAQSETQLLLDAGPSGSGTVTGTGSAAALGTDSFTGIERIAYDDAVWALDTRAPGENAYHVLAMHNAAFNALPTPEVLGQFLPVADASGDLADVAQAMLDFYLPGGVGNFELVLHLYVQILLPPGNTLGQQDLDLIAFYASLIGPGQQFPTQADLCAAAALLPENTSEFVGLIADGVALPSDWYAA